MNDRQIIRERFAEAGVAEDRFVSVKEGEKACVDHDTRYSDPDEVPGTNYGIYADDGDQLLILDVDDHAGGDGDHSPVGKAALEGLPETLLLKSPHVPDDTHLAGHDLYKIDADEPAAQVLKEKLGTKNPMPTWGEAIVANKYVVGAGSVLDGCGKDWCEDCATDTGGQYEVAEDRPIATVDAETLVEALAADPDIQRADQSPTNTGTGDMDNTTELTEEQVKSLLDKLPGTQHYDDWIRTGFAVYSWDGGARGKRVFENWSRSNPKWDDRESQRRIDHIWDNATSGDGASGVGVGTLVHMARQHGDTSDILASSYDADPSTPAELVAEYSDEYDDPDEVPDNLLSLVEDDEESDEKPAESDEGDGTDQEGLSGTARDWSDVRTLYQLVDEDEARKSEARLAAAQVLEKETSWMYVKESKRLWVYSSETGQYDREGEGTIARILENELPTHKTKNEKNEICDRIADRNQVARAELNARSFEHEYLCVGNGVVDLRTGEIYDHDPAFRFTRGLQWDYKPDDGGVDREAVLEFLDEVTQREADRDTLLDHLGHGLMPGHPYRAFVVCYGPGGNGKTQVAEVFRGFVGRENAAAVEIDELANDDYSTSDLPGTFINWGDDMAGDGGGTLQDLSLLKKATGGSEIRCNEKFEKTFNFKNEAAMFFSANEPPRIGEQKQSIQDRIFPIRMPYRFVSDPDTSNPLEKQKVPNVSQQLLDDDDAMRGLLALAVEHAQDVIENRGQYSQPETPEERLEKYNSEADPLMRFANEAFEPASGDHRIRKDDAYTVYTHMMDLWEERTAGEDGFKRQLPRALSHEIETGQSRALSDDDDRVWCWKHVKWADQAQQWLPDWMLERYGDHFADEGSDADADADEPDSNEPTPLGALDLGRHDLEATVATVSKGEYNREAQGDLKGPHGTYVGFVIPGGNANVAADLEGETVRFENVKLRTDDDGLREVVINDATTVTIHEDKQTGLDHDPGDGDTQATADGGQSTDLESTKPRVVQAVRQLEGEHPKGVPPEAIVEDVDAPESRVRSAIDSALTDGALTEPREGHYRAT